jgi:hypothetical protein
MVEPKPEDKGLPDVEVEVERTEEIGGEQTDTDIDIEKKDEDEVNPEEG